MFIIIIEVKVTAGVSILEYKGYSKYVRICKSINETIIKVAMRI